MVHFRECKRCGEFFRTVAKHGHICDKCNKHIINSRLPPEIRKRIYNRIYGKNSKKRYSKKLEVD